jgi:ADP-ribose pyrophosphatase YjhB (NUDIX family)
VTLHLAAAAAVLDGNRILLTKREDFAVWCLPGGGIDDGESPAEAAAREAREETGLEVEVTHLVGTHTRPSWLDGDTCLLVFAARAVGGALRPDPREVLEARFFEPDALPAPLFWHHVSPIEGAFAGVAGAAWRYTGQPPRRFASRAELYALRDRSGLTRQAFYLRHLGTADPSLEVLEAPGRVAPAAPAWSQPP